MIDLSRLLIVGGESAIAKELPFGIKLTRKELDVTDALQIEKAFLRYAPSAVLCLASVDLYSSEKNPQTAYEVNVVGMYNVVMQASKRGIPIIMISTGAVFSGNSEEKFNESDNPNPLNIYGNTKYLAEMLLQQITQNHLIVRTGWLFGFNYKKSGFSKFIDKVIDSTNVSGIIATDDSTGSPTYIVDFVKALEELMLSGAKGIFHTVNAGCVSAYEIASEVCLITNKKNLVQPAMTNSQAGKGIPLRSKSECLYSKKISLRPWREALKQYCLSKEPL